VFDYLLLRPATTVPQVAEYFSLPSSTAVSVLNRLQAKGLVGRRREAIGEDEHRSSRPRGRPTMFYHVQLPGPVAAFFFDASQLAGAVFDVNGSTLARQELDLVQVDGPEGAIRLIDQLLADLLIKADVARSELACVALSINAVRTKRGVLTSSVLPWATEELDALASNQLHLPVRIAPAVTLLAEYQRLSDPLPEAMLNFRVGDGVSCHSIIHGKLSGGRNNLAGELGHVTVDPEGPKCGCGKRGCLEAYVGAQALCRTLLDQLKQGAASSLDAHHLERSAGRSAIEHVWQRWQQGDTLTRHVMDESLDLIAWALSLAVNLYDPDLIRVGGHVLQGRQAWIDEIEKRVRPHLVNGKARELAIESAQVNMGDMLRLTAYASVAGS